METNQVMTYWNRNRENAMGLGWPHALETDIQRYKTGPNMESTGQNEER